MSGCLDHNLCLQYFHLFPFVSAALTLTSQIKNFPVTLLLLPLKRFDTNAYSRSRLCTPTLIIYLRCHTHYQLLPGIIIFPRSWPMFPGPPLANLTQPSQQQHPLDSRIHPSCLLPQTLLLTTAFFWCECLRTRVGWKDMGQMNQRENPRVAHWRHLSTEQPWGSTALSNGHLRVRAGQGAGKGPVQPA